MSSAIESSKSKKRKEKRKKIGEGKEGEMIGVACSDTTCKVKDLKMAKMENNQRIMEVNSGRRRRER